MKEVKKVLIGLVSIIVLLVAADWAVGTWSEKMYYKSKYGMYRRQIYVMKEANEDLLIMGSSRAAHHYVPQILEDSLGMTCYNAGSDGECIYYHYCLLASMIERGHMPKVVVYEVMNLDADVSKISSFTLDAALERLAPHYGESASVDSLFALNGWKERVKLLSKTYRYNSKLVQTIKCNYIPWPEDRGYEALTGKMNVELTNQELSKSKSASKNVPDIEDGKLDYMEKFVSLCKTNNIKLVMCFSPYYQTKPSKSVFMIRDIAQRYGYPFYEFSTDKDFEDPELFQDVMHLNDTGARLYTNKIIKLIK